MLRCQSRRYCRYGLYVCVCFYVCACLCVCLCVSVHLRVIAAGFSSICAATPLFSLLWVNPYDGRLLFGCMQLSQPNTALGSIAIGAISLVVVGVVASAVFVVVRLVSKAASKPLAAQPDSV